MQQAFKHIIIGGCLLLLAAACYEPTEGCLDIEATNFDVDADESCSGCCSYPDLRVNLLHRLVFADTTLNFALNTPYSLNGVDSFRLGDLRFYLSDFRLLRPDGTQLGVHDSVEIAVPSSRGDTTLLTIEDNFALINRAAPSTVNIGTIRETGDFGGMAFNIGVSTPANHADPEKYASDHPLFLEDGAMHFSIDSGYIFQRIDLFRGVLATDTIPVPIRIGTDAQLQTITINTPFSIPTGFNMTTTLQFNYVSWLEQVDVINDDEATIERKILAGLANSIEIADIQYSTN